MARGDRPDATEGQPSLGELVATAVKDISSLLRYEISLAVSELKSDGKKVALVAGIAVVALFGVCLILVLLCFAFAFALVALGAPGGTYGAFLWVALAVFVLILLGGATAFLVIRRVTGLRLTRKTVKDDIGMLRRSEPSVNGQSAGGSAPAVTGTRPAAEIPAARP